MNQNMNKTGREEASEDILPEALKLYDEGKPVSDILALFPDQKEELSRMFKAINVLEKQKDAVVAPKELLTKIISAVPQVTSMKDGRYSFGGDRMKSSVPASRPFDLLKAFTMKKMYAGVIALLLVVVAVGISSRYKGGDITVNLPAKEVNKLALDQEVLGKDVADLEAIAADDGSFDSIDGDLAGIAEEQTGAKGPSTDNKTSKSIDVAYLDTLEKDFGSQVASFSSDSQDLEGINSDISSNVLDGDLGGI